MSWALRLRGNANALNCLAQENRRALKQSQSGKDTTRRTGNTDGRAAAPKCTQAEAGHRELIVAIRPDPVQAAHAATPAESRTDEQKVLAAISQGPATPTVVKPAPPVSQPLLASPTEQKRQRLWAAAMNDVANKYIAGLPQLPPEKRKAAFISAAALRCCATDLRSRRAPLLRDRSAKARSPEA